MNARPEELAASLLAELQRSVNPERREFVKGYAPTAEAILGVTVPVLRRAARRIRAEVRREPLEVRLTLASKILRLGFLETRQAAYELLAPDATSLTRKQLEALGRGIDNWATVDAFGTLLVGPAWIGGSIDDDDIGRWARSSDPWWRRLALVAVVCRNVPSRGGNGDSARTIALCTKLADDDDRFVQKAISWALRTLVRWDPPAVRSFLETHAEQLSAFVHREVNAKLRTGRKSGK